MDFDYKNSKGASSYYDKIASRKIKAKNIEGANNNKKMWNAVDANIKNLLLDIDSKIINFASNKKQEKKSNNFFYKFNPENENTKIFSDNLDNLKELKERLVSKLAMCNNCLKHANNVIKFTQIYNQEKDKAEDLIKDLNKFMNDLENNQMNFSTIKSKLNNLNKKTKKIKIPKTPKIDVEEMKSFINQLDKLKAALN